MLTVKKATKLNFKPIYTLFNLLCSGQISVCRLDRIRTLIWRSDFCEFNWRKEKGRVWVRYWYPKRTNVQKCQSICARNNRPESASSYVRHLISFGTLKTHSEVPFPRMDGDSDDRLSEQHSDTIVGITSFYSSSSKLDLEIAQRRIRKSCGIIEADRRRKNWPVYVSLRRFAVGATDHRQETVIVPTL